MKNEFLQALRNLKKDLDEGRISQDEYAQRRRRLLDELDPSDDSALEASDDSTVSDLLEDSDTVSDFMEEENTVSHLLDKTAVKMEEAPTGTVDLWSAAPDRPRSRWLWVWVGLGLTAAGLGLAAVLGWI